MYNSLTILVRVLREGVFNGRDHKALPHALVGDVIEVAGGGYGDSLIADGWVTDDLSIGIPEPELLGGDDWGHGAGDKKRSRANVLGLETGDEGRELANPVPVDNSAADAENGSRANVLEDAQPVDDLSLIKGIGPKTAAHFVEHGWTTFAGLAEADVEEVASAAKVTVAKAQAWINEARELAG